MAYYSDTATEKEIKALEKDIAEVYKQASHDVALTADKYFANFTDRYANEYAAFLKGEGGYSDPTTAKQKFDAWYMAQVGRGEKWEALRDQLAQRMTDANKVAASYINDKTPGIYSLNANYEAYQIYNSTGVDFNLVDEQTVKGLMTGKTKMLPVSRVDIPVDEKWNEKQLSKALLGGILQGQGIDKIATSFQNVANMDRTSALRNARTSMTGAQNAGRQSTYEAAKEMGIDIKKEWIATEDDRTRESHAELDGVQVDYDEEFPNGLMYPGDPKGDPSEVYNCRCTMRAIIPKYNGQQRTSDIEGHEGDHTKETYEEWKERKEEEKAEREANAKPWTSAQASAEAMEKKEDNRTRLGGKYKSEFSQSSTISKIEKTDIEYNEVAELKTKMTEKENIDAISGDDYTDGSCASAALAFIGRENGYDVLDFRGGNSEEYFSDKENLENAFNDLGINSIIINDSNSSLANGIKALDEMEAGRYYFTVGQHSTIVDKDSDGNLKYLELQEKDNKGWRDFDWNIGLTLTWRFGCEYDAAYDARAILTNVNEFNNNKGLAELLGYINTSKDLQLKGDG